MPVYCQAIDGPFDGGMWTTMSPHTRIHVSLDTIKHDNSDTLWSYDVRLVPFRNSQLYYHHSVSADSGFHRYSICQPTPHVLNPAFHPT